MPRYFFNVANGVRAQDFDGMVLPNLEAAKQEAEKDIADIKDSKFTLTNGDWSSYSIEICEGKGAIVLVVPFSKN